MREMEDRINKILDENKQMELELSENKSKMRMI